MGDGGRVGRNGGWGRREGRKGKGGGGRVGRKGGMGEERGKEREERGKEREENGREGKETLFLFSCVTYKSFENHQECFFSGWAVILEKIPRIMEGSLTKRCVFSKSLFFSK